VGGLFSESPAALESKLMHSLFRHMEDFVTWVDTSKLKRTIMKYNDEVSYFVLSVDLDTVTNVLSTAGRLRSIMIACLIRAKNTFVFVQTFRRDSIQPGSAMHKFEVIALRVRCIKCMYSNAPQVSREYYAISKV
jgi:hypothetical protein